MPSDPASHSDSTSVAPQRAALHLLFVPGAEPHWLLWGAEAAHSPLAVMGEPCYSWLPDETLKIRRVRGYRLPLLEGVVQLAALTHSELALLPASLAVWSLASKLALELVAAEKLVPHVIKQSGQQVARWMVCLHHAPDQTRLRQLAAAFPVAAYAVPVQKLTAESAQQLQQSGAQTLTVWSAEPLLREFLNTSADQLVRFAAPALRGTTGKTWPQRLQQALLSDAAEFVPEGAAERQVLSDLRDWIAPVQGGPAAAVSLQLRLVLPEQAAELAGDVAGQGDLTTHVPGNQPFTLEFQLRHADGVTVTARQLFEEGARAARILHSELRALHELLLQQLAIAARTYLPIEMALRTSAQPVAMTLKPRQAYELLQQSAALEQAGIQVLLPAAVAPGQQQRLCMQLILSGTAHDRELPFVWRAMLAGRELQLEDIEALQAQRTPLASFHGTWVVLDAAELTHAHRLLTQAGGVMTRSVALSLALLGVMTQKDSPLTIEVSADGELRDWLMQLRASEASPVLAAPPGLQATLRPYQQRGFSWLAHVTGLGLGACLADDMGLGKTIQLLAFVLHAQQQGWLDKPVLLVCPMSVIGNWEREIVRFAPSLKLMRHYGIERHQNAEDFVAQAAGKLVLTSYGLLRRDADWLQDVELSLCVLDEAQFIKNSAAATARAARKLKSARHIALTGTPVENHLTELWSIMEFLNPGLLGPRETFRREVAIPVERYGRNDVADQLRRMIAPFVLRRVKTDPTVISDLPAKQESKVYCSLTREQAQLYQSAVNEAMLEIEEAEGMARRGRVLALLTALKQICNHPAHYLREQGPLTGRSGKLDRMLEMLQQVLDSGDRALIFTQYREMGERLSSALTRLHRKSVPFLHGGVSRVARDEMVRRFQDSRGSHLLVISLKAGGTGLNLTAATRVFHFDRWWNPAVEDQATDRAYRIGQQQTVQVYKLLCAGTVEDKIDHMLEAKRELAERVVTAGEAWLSELDNGALRELFALAPDAVVSDIDADDAEAERTAPARPVVVQQTDWLDQVEEVRA